MDKLFSVTDIASALDEIDKCKYCKDAKCTNICPFKVDIKKILELIQKGKYEDALSELLSKNIMPEYTSYICDERPLCVAKCMEVNSKKHIFDFNSSNTYVNFPELERFILTHVRDTMNNKTFEVDKVNKKVAIIGSNAIGLSCAYLLALKGYDVTIIEKDILLAQDMRLGLINANKANEIVDRYEEDLKALGVTILTNQAINVDFDLSKLKREYNYLVLTSNFEVASTINIPGETKAFSSPINDVLHLVSYTKDFVKLTNRNEYFKEDDKVIVIGASNLALDTARIVHKFCDNVTLSFMNNSKNIGVSNDELEKNELKNLNVQFNARPIKISIVNREVQVTYRKTKNVLDEHMRKELEDVFDTEWTETCDHLIIDSDVASSINDQIAKLSGIQLNKDQTVKVDENNIATNDGSVYCAGELTGEIESTLFNIRRGMNIANSIIKDSMGEAQELMQDYFEE